MGSDVCSNKTQEERSLSSITLSTTGARDETQTVRHLLAYLGMPFSNLSFSGDERQSSTIGTLDFLGLSAPPFLSAHRTIATSLATMLKYVAVTTTSPKGNLFGRSSWEKAKVIEVVVQGETIIKALLAAYKTDKKADVWLFQSKVQPLTAFIQSKLKEQSHCPLKEPSLGDFVVAESARLALHLYPGAEEIKQPLGQYLYKTASLTDSPTQRQFPLS